MALLADLGLLVVGVGVLWDLSHTVLDQPVSPRTPGNKMDDVPPIPKQQSSPTQTFAFHGPPFYSQGGSATQWLEWEGHGGPRVTAFLTPAPWVQVRLKGYHHSSPRALLVRQLSGRLNRPREGGAALGLRWGHREPRSLRHHWPSAKGNRSVQ